MNHLLTYLLCYLVTVEVLQIQTRSSREELKEGDGRTFPVRGGWREVRHTRDGRQDGGRGPRMGLVSLPDVSEY